jgi:histidine kinase/DNA gyrase B/HSP90-like ATPase
MQALKKLEPKGEKLSIPVVVGKDVLELLSSAMYVDPLTIYREYIQNSADAIDSAKAAGLYVSGNQPRIDVFLDIQNRVARIRDNGIGLKRSVFAKRLTSLGASKKRGTRARGFRGVGRLCGLGYCQELVMRSKAADDSCVSEIRWDCRELKRRLRDHTSDEDVSQIIWEITEFAKLDCDGYPEHFFEVELVGVLRYRNDLLLDDVSVSRYLAQAAPVPFNEAFSFREQISQLLSKHGINNAYDLYVNNSQRIVRPYADEFRVSQTLKDSFGDLETFEIPGLGDETAAIGWILHHGYYGALPESLNTKGLRARVENMQIGSENILQGSFPEPRFNAWTVGEVHVLHSPNLVPNGRRDDFELNNHYLSLLNQLLPIGRRIAKICRAKSSERNQALRARAAAPTLSNPPPDVLNALDTSPLGSLHPIKKEAYLEVFEILSKIPQLPNRPKDLVRLILTSIELKNQKNRR